MKREEEQKLDLVLYVRSLLIEFAMRNKHAIYIHTTTSCKKRTHMNYQHIVYV